MPGPFWHSLENGQLSPRDLVQWTSQSAMAYSAMMRAREDTEKYVGVE